MGHSQSSGRQPYSLSKFAQLPVTSFRMDRRSGTVNSRSVFAIGSHPPSFVFWERKLSGLPSHYGYGEILKKQAKRRTSPFKKTGQPPYVFAALPEPVPARRFTQRFLPLGTLVSPRCFPGGHIPFGRSFSFQGSPVASNAGESVRILQQKKGLSRISKRMEKTHKI